MGALTMATDGGQLLRILISRDAQTAAQLARASGLSPAESLRRLQGLLADGFIIAADDADVRVYRLSPKGVQPGALDPHQHILLVEDDLMVRELVVGLLEDEGYAVIAAAIPADAAALLERVGFDLVITDGFDSAGSAILSSV
jgi:PleD family two-component response regulator